MNAIPSSDAATVGFQFGALASKSNTAFGSKNSSAATKSTTDGADRTHRMKSAGRNAAVACRRSGKFPAAVAPTSARTWPTDSAAMSETGTALKSFGGFNFCVSSSTGCTVASTTSSGFSFANVTKAPTTIASIGNFSFAPLSDAVTTVAPIFGVDSVGIDSLPSTEAIASTAAWPKFGCLTQINDTWAFTAPNSSSVPSISVPSTTTALAKPEHSNAGSTAADLIAFTATTQSVDAPISSTSQYAASNESEMVEQEEVKVFANQATQVNNTKNSPNPNDLIVKWQNPNLHELTHISQIITKLDDINFSLSILICIFFFAIAFHVSSSFK